MHDFLLVGRLEGHVQAERKFAHLYVDIARLQVCFVLDIVDYHMFIYVFV